MKDQPAKPKAAWKGDSPQVAAARERLLAATARCIARDGLARTSMAAVAAEAGVSRQTVYRYFAGRDSLALQTIFSAADALSGQIASHVAGLSDPADIFVEAMVLSLAKARSDPVLHAIWDSASPDGVVAAIFTHPAGIAWMRGALTRGVELAGWSDADADTAIEFYLRIGLSLMVSALPERNDEELRAFLYRHLIPGLGLADSEAVPE